jgi:NADPH2 dehydrogenase
MSKLFSPLTIKNMNLKNRIVMAPMCMYRGDEAGYTNNFHLVHYTTRAIGGVGLIIMEATAVESRGRIDQGDLGIWDDSHTVGLKSIVDEVHRNDAKIGIQLAHAGRKCSIPTESPISPSAISFSDRYQKPQEMTKADIKAVIEAFKAGAKRADEAGFDLIEIHAAHGYLINQFLSPLTNQRTDEYGGNLTNRMRFLEEIIEAVKTVWPSENPLGVRLSADEYAEGGNHLDDISQIVEVIKSRGVDVINVTSGGVVATTINLYPGYQVKFAEHIKHHHKITTMAGGLITHALMCEEILQNDRADLVFLGRVLLSQPYFALHAQLALEKEPILPQPYKRAF